MIPKILKWIVVVALVAAAIALGANGVQKIIAFHQHRAASAPAPEPRPALTVAYSRAASSFLPPNSPLWRRAPALSVTLMAQVLVLPWGQGVTPSVEVSAIHDDRMIAFRLSWPDATRNAKLVRNDDRPDGAAIMFPIGQETPSSIMMGFLRPANIWHWKAARRHTDRPKVYIDFYNPNEAGTLLATHREDLIAALPGSEIIDNTATMPGTLTPKAIQKVAGRGIWENNRWLVTFSRPLTTTDEADSQFNLTSGNGAAFAIWDGEHHERGSRKSISDWVQLRFASREAGVQ